MLPLKSHQAATTYKVSCVARASQRLHGGGRRHLSSGPPASLFKAVCCGPESFFIHSVRSQGPPFALPSSFWDQMAGRDLMDLFVM